MGYLDHLAAFLRCDYLSDLRCRTITRTQANRLLSEPLDYPAEDYREAGRYLLGKDFDETLSPAGIRGAVVSRLLGTSLRE